MRRYTVLIAAASVALALAGCGGTSHASTSGSATSTTTAGGRGFLNSAFTTCLKQHGITLQGLGGRRGGAGAPGNPGATGPRGTGPRGSGLIGGFLRGRGTASKKQQAAFNACRSKLPNGGQFPGGGFGGGANRAAIQAYVSCLGDHGVTVPKPAASTPGSGSRPVGGVRSPLDSVRNNPKFAAANKICRALLPTAGG